MDAPPLPDHLFRSTVMNGALRRVNRASGRRRAMPKEKRRPCPYSVTPGQVETRPWVNLSRASRQEMGKMARAENLTRAGS
jgi:hypothetical protein